MKRISHFLIFLFVFLCFWLLTLSHSAIASTQTFAPRHSSYYVGVAGGAALPGNNSNVWWPVGAWNSGYVIDGQIGYWYKNFRFAGAIDYYNHQITQTTSWMIGITTIMGNIYYDFNYGNSLIPYLGLGAGWLGASLNYNTQFLNNAPSKNSFAYQGIAGICLPINPSLAVDASYHYLKWTNASGNDNAVAVGIDFFF